MSQSFSQNWENVLSFRAPAPADESFLFELYASTRQEEMEVSGWNEDQRNSFLRMQFLAQRSHYQTFFPDAEHTILVVDGKPAGRMLINRHDSEILLVDISLLPEYCNAGIGTYVLKRLLREGAARGNSVRLHVLKFSRALQLYERLGFSPVSDKGMYLEMIWQSPRPSFVEDATEARKR